MNWLISLLALGYAYYHRRPIVTVGNQRYRIVGALDEDGVTPTIKLEEV